MTSLMSLNVELERNMHDELQLQHTVASSCLGCDSEVEYD